MNRLLALYLIGVLITFGVKYHARCWRGRWGWFGLVLDAMFWPVFWILAVLR